MRFDIRKFLPSFSKAKPIPAQPVPAITTEHPTASALAQSVDQNKVARFKELGTKISNLASYNSWADWEEDKRVYQVLHKEITHDLNKFVGKHVRRRKEDGLTIADLMGEQSYQPVSSTFVGFFDGNPSEAYSYIFKYHPIAYRCNEILREEIANDGYGLRAVKGAPKRRLKEVHQLFKAQNLKGLRLNICSDLKIFGNCYLVKDKDEKTGKQTLRILSPLRMTFKFDRKTERISEYKYFIGDSCITYKPSQIYHLTMFNPDSTKQIGDPPLQAALLDIEIDFAQKGFAREVMEKGFMGGVVFSIEPPESEDFMADDLEEVVSVVRDYIDAEFSGAQNAGRGLVLSHLKDAKNISPVGKYENAYEQSIKEKAKIICMCLGIPSEKLGIARNDAQQYVAVLVEYGVNASFDKSLTYLVDYVDEFLNEEYVKGIHKIYDVRFEAGGRFGSLTKTAAEVIKLLAEAGPLITVNQALADVLGWEPLPPDNPRGYYVLDNSIGRKADSLPLMIDPETPDLDLGGPTGLTFKNAPMMSWDEFYSIAQKIREDQFVAKDLTYSENDEDEVTVLKVKKGQEKFLMEIKR